MTFEDMFSIATSELGISFFDYYEITPYELGLIMKGYVKKKKEDLEAICRAVKIGTYNANRGKSLKMFADKKEKTSNTKSNKTEMEILKSKLS